MSLLDVDFLNIENIVKILEANLMISIALTENLNKFSGHFLFFKSGSGPVCFLGF